MVTIESEALKLVDYLRDLPDFQLLAYKDGGYGHMGATITDAILQAGTTYATVVRPRVGHVMRAYPGARTTSAFLKLVGREGVKTVLQWQDDEKPRRVVALTRFLLAEGVETEADLAAWLAVEANGRRQRVSEVSGAVWRYVRINQAEVDVKGASALAEVVTASRRSLSAGTGLTAWVWRLSADSWLRRSPSPRR